MIERIKAAKISRRRFLGSTGKLVLGIVGVEAAAGGLFYHAAKSNKGEQEEQSGEKPGNIVLLGDKTKLGHIVENLIPKETISADRRRGQWMYLSLWREKGKCISIFLTQ
ncbi:MULTISPECIES: hypothetical protein [unclassified Paenibacillus]|uniref:hypothetical protein n=1 Tax=unclassified Paenibacillus TaxID=185978 RepID=UPI001AE6AE09|nr:MULTISPECIES: hypothetical protein [unclassified Paenibacillus]MBP1156956.1 hypothetical protein [Paenibacillus sp. PvP091]MBP1172305.1 hypothetical protein [Paenibacillus sp. PvR098]MBP2438686.1 hypothetical protein [Paenibacillus sp. PvP052]